MGHNCVVGVFEHVQNGNGCMYRLERKDLVVGTLAAFHDHNRILEHRNLERNHRQHFEDGAQHHSYWIVAGTLGLSSGNLSPSPSGSKAYLADLLVHPSF